MSISSSASETASYALPDNVDPGFYEAVMACFRTPERRAIPARWLYDQAGSELFEAITELPEYYPTRTETALLEQRCPDVAEITGKGGCVVEFGSGSSTKTPHLLRAVAPVSYVPIDISGDFLRQSAEALASDFPAINVLPLEGDFMGDLVLPEGAAGQRRLGFFPGSTIGNMVPRTSVDLLRSMRNTLGTGAYLLIGIDRIKSPDVLVPAYDDSAGVTAEFNYNLLRRINSELDGTIPVQSFRHEARWNDNYARIEMHLEALNDIAFEVAGEGFTMAKGETIHTENSHKYGPRDARLMLRAGGWVTVAEWTDPKDWFALILAEAKPYQSAP
ncbi:L-histidine N(alpha)-methyltransferase [Alterisphingorhabdus coralli]